MKPECAVEGCDRPASCREWCGAHYERVQKHGDPRAHIPITIRGNTEARFWSKVDRRGPDECWPWKGPLKGGYGGFHVPGTAGMPAHRYSWILANGPIAPELVVDHVCHNVDRSCGGGESCPHRACCNPAHLEPVTRSLNFRRGKRGMEEAESNRCPRGHSYDGPNGVPYPSTKGFRDCRECKRLQCMEWYYRVGRAKRAAKKAEFE